MIGRFLRFIILTFIILVVIVGAVIAAIPYVFPPEKFKPIIKEYVKEQTGRDLDIEGEISFSVFPALALKATDITFSNAPDGVAKEMAALSSVSVGVKLIPLLSRNLQLDDFILINPVINLEINKSGISNWTFPQSAPSTTEPGTSSPAAAAGIVFSELKIINGTITYNNRATGDKYSVTNLNLAVKARTLTDKLNATGGMALNGQNVEFAVNLDSVQKIIDKSPAALEANITLPFLKVDYNGSLALADSPDVDGKLTLSVESLNKALAWATGGANNAAQADHQINLSSPLTFKANKVNLSNLEAQFDNIRAAGSLSADLSGKTPDIKANLSTSELDLTPYLNQAPAAAPEAPAQTGEQGLWSNEEIAFGGLTAVDAMIEASIGKIILPQTTINDTAITVQTKGGKMTALLKETKLYGGMGKAQLVVDGRGAVPSVANTLSLEGIDVGKLLSDFAHTDKLVGKGDVNLNVSALGRSQLEMVNNLDGQGNIHLYNAKYTGINIMNIANTINAIGSAGATLQNIFKADTSTDVSDLTASFNIKGGVISNNDLQLKSPVGSVTGEGEINLAKNLIKYRISPRADVGLENSSIGLKVPVIIQGNLNNPQITADTKKLLTEGLQIKALDQNLSPGEKIEAVKDDLLKLRKGVKGDIKKNLPGLLDNLLKGGIPGVTPPPQQ